MPLFRRCWVLRISFDPMRAYLIRRIVASFHSFIFAFRACFINADVFLYRILTRLLPLLQTQSQGR